MRSTNELREGGGRSVEGSELCGGSVRGIREASIFGVIMLLFALIGITWAFHISFTVWMIPKGQTDLTYHGTFFSLVIIYLMNLLVLTVLLIVASPHVTWLAFGQDLLENGGSFAALINQLLRG